MPTSADLLLDTSVAVPLLLRRHPEHTRVREAVAGRRLGLSGHAEFETYSVITRMPDPTRISPGTAHALLKRNFPKTRYLSAERAGEILLVLSDQGIVGGSVYDALVGAAALEHRRTLATRDQRALQTYTALGVDVLLLD